MNKGQDKTKGRDELGRREKRRATMKKRRKKRKKEKTTHLQTTSSPSSHHTRMPKWLSSGTVLDILLSSSPSLQDTIGRDIANRLSLPPLFCRAHSLLMSSRSDLKMQISEATLRGWQPLAFSFVSSSFDSSSCDGSVSATPSTPTTHHQLQTPQSQQ